MFTLDFLFVRDYVQSNISQNKLSIIFVTGQSGGYDVLLHALSRQTVKEYELICIDERYQYRREQIAAIAQKLGVNLVAVSPSKAKTHLSTPFGLSNAFNTGVILASGNIITFLEDHVFVPADFVERTLHFHSKHDYALLSYPELIFSPPPGQLDATRVLDPSSISVFLDEVRRRKKWPSGLDR